MSPAPGRTLLPATFRGVPGSDPGSTRPWLRLGLLAARLVLGVVLVVAGALKLPDPAAAERAVRAYRLLPEAMVSPVAFGLPAVEIVVGLLLVVGFAVRAAAVAAVVLLVVFVAAIASAWARGLQIDCGCFGGGGEVGAQDTAYLSEALRDSGLLLLAAILIRWPLSWPMSGDPSRTTETRGTAHVPVE